MGGRENKNVVFKIWKACLEAEGVGFIQCVCRRLWLGIMGRQILVSYKEMFLAIIEVFSLRGSEAFIPGVCIKPLSLLIRLPRDTQQREGLWLKEFTWASPTFTRFGLPWTSAPFILNNLILVPSLSLL